MISPELVHIFVDEKEVQINDKSYGEAGAGAGNVCREIFRASGGLQNNAKYRGRNRYIWRGWLAVSIAVSIKVIGLSFLSLVFLASDKFAF